MSPRRWLCLVGIGLIAANAVVPSQAQSSAPSTMEALLAEVRGLRADVSQAAGASIRTQLLVARLQLQEQRITVVAKQLNDVQTQRVANDGGIAQMDTRMKRLDELTRSSTLTQEMRAQVEAERAAIKPPFDQMRRSGQELSTQESALTAQLASEQSRWIDFSDRLDQIERELAATRARQ
jgi:predicted  nucleic acid-binding Zn-ribbon protein